MHDLYTWRTMDYIQRKRTCIIYTCKCSGPIYIYISCQSVSSTPNSPGSSYLHQLEYKLILTRDSIKYRVWKILKICLKICLIRLYLLWKALVWKWMHESYNFAFILLNLLSLNFATLPSIYFSLSSNAFLCSAACTSL